MLIEFSVENFLSFKDKTVFSLLASSDDSLQYNLINLNGKKLLKSAAIYGHNASGKSNLIKAINFMKMFVINSHKNQRGDLIRVKSFKLDENIIAKPSSFEAIFIRNNIKYIYGFSVNQNQIEKEYLFSYPNNRKTTIFYREKQNYKFTMSKKEQKELSNRTLENVLYLSSSANWNFVHTSNAFDFFKKDLDVIYASKMTPKLTVEIFNKDEKLKNLIVTSLTKVADLGIKDLQASIKEVSTEEMPKDMPKPMQDFISILAKEAKKMSEALDDNVDIPKEKRGVYREIINTYHEGIDKNGNPTQVLFDFYEESKGSIQFFELLGPIIMTLVKGGVLFVDELETSLHTHLVEFLISRFNNKDINIYDAQLVFTTHNTTLLKQDIFRRDQIWFTQKNEKQSTELYSLLEFKPRKDESIEKRYLSGRYGAIPYIDDSEFYGLPKL